MSKKDKIQAKEEIFSLLNAGKFREAAVRAKALTEQFADDYEFPLMLGVALIQQEKYDKARRVLKIDPRCKEAKDSLSEHTNVNGEHRAANADFDDLYHFQNIQTQRYLDLVGREEYGTKEEAETVIGIIKGAWNERISPSSRKWDSMMPKEKTKPFESIVLDFAKAVGRWKK